MPRSHRDLAEIVQRFKKTLSSRRDCRDLTETAEIASRLPRSRRDRAKIYGDSNISPRLPRSRRESRDRAAISLRSCRDLRRHYESRRDLVEIVLRFMETLTSRRDCRDRVAMSPRLPRSRRDHLVIYGDRNILWRLPKSRHDLIENVPRLKKTLTPR